MTETEGNQEWISLSPDQFAMCICFFIFALTGKSPESQNKCSYPVEGEETKEEESYKGNAESNYYYYYYYSLSANRLTSKEKKELFMSASIQPGNPVYVAILLKCHLGSKNNMMVSQLV